MIATPRDGGDTVDDAYPQKRMNASFSVDRSVCRDDGSKGGEVLARTTLRQRDPLRLECTPITSIAIHTIDSTGIVGSSKARMAVCLVVLMPMSCRLV